MRASRNWWCVSLAAAVVAATVGFPRIRVSADEPKAAGAAEVATFHTATVTHGDLVTTVEATGTMEPEAGRRCRLTGVRHDHGAAGRLWLAGRTRHAPGNDR